MGEDIDKGESSVSTRHETIVKITVLEELFKVIIGIDEFEYNFAEHGYKPWSVDHVKVFF